MEWPSPGAILATSGPLGVGCAALRCCESPLATVPDHDQGFGQGPIGSVRLGRTLRRVVVTHRGWTPGSRCEREVINGQRALRSAQAMHQNGGPWRPAAVLACERRTWRRDVPFGVLPSAATPVPRLSLSPRLLTAFVSSLAARELVSHARRSWETDGSEEPAFGWWTPAGLQPGVSFGRTSFGRTHQGRSRLRRPLVGRWPRLERALSSSGSDASGAASGLRTRYGGQTWSSDHRRRARWE